MTDETTEKTDTTPVSDEGKTLEPLQVELKKEQERKVRTEKEKAEFSLRKNAERLKELGGSPAEILGVEKEEVETDIPDWYKKEKAKEQTKTALQIADSLTDPDTKSLVKTYLENRIVPSGNPEDDFRIALGAVSALKNKQVLEEINRYSDAKRTASGTSAPALSEDEFVPTEEERVMMARPYNLSKERILEARKKSQQ